MTPPRPCLERGCPRYALPGKSRCPEHDAQRRQARARAGGPEAGTTGAWRKARAEALRRAGHRCQRCGSRTRLEVHHLDGGGVGQPHHDIERLLVLCADCHRREHHPGTRPPAIPPGYTLDELLGAEDPPR